MKLGFRGENVLEKLLLATGLLPEMAFLPFFATVVGNAVLTAQRLGVFALLETQRLSAAEAAKKLKADEHGTRVLLEALTSFGYLERRDGRFEASGALRKCLNGKMSETTRAMMTFAPDIGRNFERLDEAVKTGEVDNFHFAPATPTCWAHYLNFLKGVSGDVTKTLLKRVKFSTTPRKMLDVAGGPAQYSIAFCRQYAGLEAIVLDLPESAEEGLKEIQKAGLDGRISYITGDLFETDWGVDYDFALLSNILHALSAEQCRAAIRKTYEALAPGGLIVTNDVDFPGEDEPLDMIAGWSSLLYFTTTGGRTHPTSTIERWLVDAGFKDVKKTKIRSSAQLTGRK